MRTTTIRAATAAITIAAGVMLPSFADKTLNDGLVAYLPFDDGTAANVVTGSPVTPEPSIGTAPTFVGNGMVGKCLNIPSGAYVKLIGSDSVTLANNSLGFEDSNKSFTAIIWANHGALSGDPVVFANKNWSGIAKGALLSAKTVNKLPAVQFNAGNGSSRIDQTASTMQFTGEGSGKWTFYAMVCTNGTFYCYQGKSDGTFSAKNPATLSNFDMDTGYPFVLGQQGNCTYGNIFTGQLDDFALWNRALSRDDIHRIYECGRTGMELGDLLKIDANDDPVLTVDANDNDSVTLSFGGRRTQPLALCLAYGAADGGDDKYAWNSFSNLAEVAATDTSYTFVVPSWMKTDLRYRFFLMQTNNLPYVREVKYVKSAGTSYINTGVAPRCRTTAEFDVMLEVQNGTWDWVCGAMASDKVSNFGLAHCANDLWHVEMSGSNQKPSGATLGVLHHVKLNVLQISRHSKIT